MPLSSSAVSSSSDVETGCFYPGAEQGYDGTCPQWNDQPYNVSQERLLMPHSGVQAGDDPFGYCMPSQVTHSLGQVVAFEDHALQQPYLSSAGYIQQESNLSQSMPVYSWDSNPAAENHAEPKILDVGETKVLSSGDAGPSNSEDLKPVKSEIKFEIKASPMPLESKMHPFTSSSNFSGHSITSLKAPQIHAGIQPVRISQGYHNSTKIPSPSYQGQNFLFPRNTFSGSRSIHPTVNNNYCFQLREKSNLNKSYGVPNELVRGPRATRVKPPLSSAVEKDSLNSCVRRDHYNKPDFQVKYDRAKFFMIKSYSEDDIHKSIKYSVWASTPNGNNKLDVAFQKADMEKIEKGIECPVFLFFSVNASGQFVGLAEMIGPVDFKKSMDFWQQDKWNGFFPVKWHIIKDIPNKFFQHITLENNDNKAVTFSRDTQEIKLPQGLSMLQIFKGYQSGTSMLDDFDFYEEKKSLPAKKSNQPAVMPPNVDAVNDSSMKHLKSSFGNMNVSARTRRPYAESQYSTSNITRRPFVNCRLPMHRS